MRQVDIVSQVSPRSSLCWGYSNNMPQGTSPLRIWWTNTSLNSVVRITTGPEVLVVSSGTKYHSDLWLANSLAYPATGSRGISSPIPSPSTQLLNATLTTAIGPAQRRTYLTIYEGGERCLHRTRSRHIPTLHLTSWDSC